jgi:quercetin dioxygenase-like cupin family protein
MPVFLDVIEGTKNMIVAGEWQTLRAGQTLYIAANTPHEAINQDDSLMLSFGLESYMIDSQ